LGGANGKRTHLSGAVRGFRNSLSDKEMRIRDSQAFQSSIRVSLVFADHYG
jgi:hypothetical protein